MSSFDFKKALTRVVTGTSIATEKLKLLDFSNVVSYRVCKLNGQRSNTRLTVVLDTGRQRNHDYNREDIKQVILSELGNDVEVMVSSDVTTTTVAKFFTDMGIAINPEEIAIAPVGTTALRLFTTDKSIRYYGDLVLLISADGNEQPVFLKTQSGDLLLDQSGSPIKTNETVVKPVDPEPTVSEPVVEENTPTVDDADTGPLD